MSVIEARLPYLEPLRLGRGSHPPPDNGLVEACVMEAVAYVAGEPFTDHPACASPILTSFLIGWNDAMDDEDRQMLKPYITRLVGTRGTAEHEEIRAWMLTDWLARECAPAWLRLAGLAERADALERLAPLTSEDKGREALPPLSAARKDSAAAWAAAWDGAWVAAWDAAGVAAGVAAGAAARDAAWDAAGDAAWDAARAAARDAARAAARDAARAAARNALAPTTRRLQQSALLLLDRMIEVGRT